MVRYCCQICKRKFASSSGLTQHANAVHRGRKTISRQIEHIPRQIEPLSRPMHNEDLWRKPIVLGPSFSSEIPMVIESTATMSEEEKHADNGENMVEETLEYADASFPIEGRYNLRSQAMQTDSSEAFQEASEAFEEESEESSEESLLTDVEDIGFDLEDLQGATFEDALETIDGKNKPERLAEWPNDAYRDFMELVIEGNISNKIGDSIIKFFNKHSNLEESPLPKSTKSGKDYLNHIKSPAMDFKEKVVATYSGMDFLLYYRPIFRAIQTLLQRPGITDNFVQRGILRKEKVC